MLFKAKHWVKFNGGWIAPGEVFSSDSDATGELSAVADVIDSCVQSVPAENTPTNDEPTASVKAEEQTPAAETSAPKSRGRKKTK